MLSYLIKEAVPLVITAHQAGYFNVDWNTVRKVAEVKGKDAIDNFLNKRR